MFFAASFPVFVLAKTFLHAPLRTNWWLGIKNLPDYPYFEGSQRRHCTVVFYVDNIYTYGDDNDDIAGLVMRNKAIQVDTKPAGRTESVALIW